MRKLGLNDARGILRMICGEPVAASRMSADMLRLLSDEGLIISSSSGSRCRYGIKPSLKKACRDFIAQYYGLTCSLEEWIDIQERQRSKNRQLSRAEQVHLAGNSKLSRTRVFQGFLINSYEPIEAELNGNAIVVAPPEGSCMYISDIDTFNFPGDVTVVGIENGENFFAIRRQREFFEHNIGLSRLLFVSRYPQNGAKALQQWLTRIPNKYVHFGDYDLAGINIFLTEFKPWLGDRASYLIPCDVANRIATGNSRLYDHQYARFKNMTSDDAQLSELIALIHHHRRVYEQEGYIISPIRR